MTTDGENTYLLGRENVSELARLRNQDRTLTKLSGLLPNGLVAVQNVLDLACGVGMWCIDVAHSFPDARVVGVDISEKMIEYAWSQAEWRASAKG